MRSAGTAAILLERLEAEADETKKKGKAIPHLCDRQLFLTRFCGRVILSGLVLICPITPPFFFLSLTCGTGYTICILSSVPIFSL